jgi:predicted deacetylase
MSTRALVVSIHDVSPATREPVAAILDALGKIGVPRTSLLVIPDHHHRGRITADPAFVSWLRSLVAAGHEPVLHGYFHQRERRGGESPGARLLTRCYTADEGEFFDVTYNEARGLLARGGRELTECAGVNPTGFIAPAWLLSRAGEEAVRTLGFAYTTRLGSISALQTGRVQRSQSLCWSVRAAWRRATSLAWNNLLFRTLELNPVARVSIHPQDFGFPAIWRQIESLVRKACEDRLPATYQDVVSRRDLAIP